MFWFKVQRSVGESQLFQGITKFVNIRLAGWIKAAENHWLGFFKAGQSFSRRTISQSDSFTYPGVG